MLRIAFISLVLGMLLVLPALPQEAAPTQPAAAAAAGSSANKAEGIELPADGTVPADEGFVTITATCKGNVKWLVISQSKVKYITNEANNSIIISIPPQQSVITVFAVGNPDGKMTEFVRTQITVNGNSPGPTPGPAPGPGPGPLPAPAGKLHVTFLIDLGNVTPDLAQLLNSQSMRKSIEDKGHFLRLYDQKAPVVAQRKLDAVMQRIGGPAVIVVQRQDGTVVAAQAVPRTEQDILGILSKVGG